MDIGAFQSKGEIIYFIKPACIPSVGFDERIINFIKNRKVMGFVELNNSGFDSFFNKVYNKIRRTLFTEACQGNSFFIISKLYYQSGGLKMHNSYSKLKKEISLGFSESYI
jgi:hypothetical protein